MVMSDCIHSIAIQNTAWLLLLQSSFNAKKEALRRTADVLSTDSIAAAWRCCIRTRRGSAS